MFAYAGLLLLPWLWFQYGFGWAITYLIFTVLLGGRVSLRVGASALAFGLVCILLLELQALHTLPFRNQHEQFPLTICADPSFKRYDDVLLGTATVASQPSELNLRRVSAAIPTKFELTPQPGLCVQGFFRVKQPFGNLLPGQFNVDKYYFSQKIDAKVTLVSLEKEYRDDRLIYRLHQRVALYFNSLDHQQLWSALVLGWSSAMSSELKELLARNQLAHMFVVSGFHIGVIAAIAHGVGYLFCRLVARLFRVPLTIRYCWVFIVTTAYVALIGWPIPAVRALVMALVPLLCVLFRIQIPAYQSILMAAILVLLIFPASWLSIGNWLSFGTVLLIIMAVRWQWFSGRSKLMAVLLFQLLMSLLSLFWSYFYGLSFNFLGFFINLIASPIISFLVFPLAILILWLPSHFVGGFEWIAEQSLIFMAHSAALGIEGSTLYATVALSIGGWLLFLVWQPNRRLARYGVLMLMCLSPVLLMNPDEKSLSSNLEGVSLRFFDVGHGLSVLINTPDTTLLFDTGGQIGREDSIYARKLATLVPELDSLIVSHSDSDHSAGVAGVLAQYPNVQVYAGQPQRLAAPSINCHQAPKLYPTLYFLPVPMSLQSSDNDQSCVLVIEHGLKRVVLTGDASRRIEYYVMQAFEHLLPFDVVVLGHHGSQSSSATDWLNANQGAKFINSGADMARGHWPALAIQSWFTQRNTELANTAKRGTLDVFVTQVDIRVKSYESAFRKRLIY